MTIAVYHNLQSGGAKKAIFEVVAALQRRGHVIDVFQPDTANTAFYNLNDVARRVTILPTHPWPGLRMFGPIREEQRTAKQAAAAINAGQYDGVIVTNSSLVQHPYIMRYLAKPFLLITQEYLRVYYERRERRALAAHSSSPPSAVRVLTNAIVTNIIAHIDRTNMRSGQKKIIANSRFAQQSLARAYGVQAEVYYCGVASAYKPSTTGEREHAVVSVGALDPFKGHEFIIASLAHVPANLRPHLIIVADRSAQPDYARRLIQLGHDQGVSVEIRSAISETELARLYASVKLTLAGNILEPFGLAPIESMACGTPVVAVREGGLSETVIDGTTGVMTERDPEHFGQAITRLLMDEAERQRLGAAGPAYVAKQFSWDTYAQRLEQDLKHFAHG